MLLLCPLDMNFPTWIKHDLTKHPLNIRLSKPEVPPLLQTFPTILLSTVDSTTIRPFPLQRKKQTLCCWGYFSPHLWPSLCQHSQDIIYTINSSKVPQAHGLKSGIQWFEESLYSYLQRGWSFSSCLLGLMRPTQIRTGRVPAENVLRRSRIRGMKPSFSTFCPTRLV